MPALLCSSASKARGTSAAPTAVLNSDNLAGFLARGYGATTFTGTRGGMFVQRSGELDGHGARHSPRLQHDRDRHDYASARG